MSAELIDLALKISQIIALLVGGLWVYVNYVRGRTHVPRLQLELKAAVLRKENRRYLLATLAVKNPGLSIVQITQKGSALLVSRLSALDEVPQVIDSHWEHDGAFDVLTKHASIEPGLTINEQKLIMLPVSESDAFLLQLRVVAHGRSWSTITIVCPGSSAGEGFV